MTRWLCALSILAAACSRDDGPPTLPPVVVMSDFRLSGVVVRGASTEWWKTATQLARFGEPVPVGVTMYCLAGTTRRGRYVRRGIVAADPRFFPLSRYIELYVGEQYLGRYLVDDTGKRIRGARVDVWSPDCREAARFGLQRGTAVLVQRPRSDARQAGSARATK